MIAKAIQKIYHHSHSNLLKNLTFGIRYSREYLTSLDINHDLIQQQNKIIEQKQLKQARFNLPYNDKNQKNIVKVRINHPIYDIKLRQPGLIKTCAIMQKQYPKPKTFVHATRKYIITSIKKARNAMHPIKKKHIFQAISICQNSHKKVANLMTKTLWNLIDHANLKGMAAMRLFIHGVLIGKTQRYFGVRYHAKGRGYRQKRDFCQVKIICYQKPRKQFYQQIADGDCAPGVSYMFREYLKNINADYKTIAKLGFMTTAKGKQQAKQLIKRKVDLKMAQNQKNNIFVPKKQVKKEILEVQGQRIKVLIQKLIENNDDQKSLINREKMFKKNMQLGG